MPGRNEWEEGCVYGRDDGNASCTVSCCGLRDGTGLPTDGALASRNGLSAMSVWIGTGAWRRARCFLGGTRTGSSTCGCTVRSVTDFPAWKKEGL
jgi:hypothetical protein